MGRNFEGANKNGLPPDNGTDISKEGKIVHFINFDILFKDNDGDLLLKNSLPGFFETEHGAFDPRVIYDHYEDRFILVVLEAGTGKILIGFSQTNDPTGKWNVYEHSTGGSIDFPLIGINEYELVVVHSKFDGDNFFEVANQISKLNGYQGEALKAKEHKFEEGLVRVITPANVFANSNYGNKMFFLGIKPQGGNQFHYLN